MNLPNVFTADPAERFPGFAEIGVDGVRIQATCVATAVVVFAGSFLYGYGIYGDLRNVPLESLALIGAIGIGGALALCVCLFIGIELWRYATGKVPDFFAYPRQG